MHTLTKALTIILVGLLLVTAALAIVGIFLPDTARVERQITIEAPEATVFALHNGFAYYRELSPWYHINPDASFTVGVPAMGEGAELAWESDQPELGTGAQVIVESTPFSAVASELDFGNRGRGKWIVNLAPTDAGTLVTWELATDLGRNVVGRYFGFLFEDMMAPLVERSLTDVKTFAENLPQDDWSDIDIEVRDLEPMTIIVTDGHAAGDHAAIGEALGSAYGRVLAYMARHGLEQAGMPLAITESWNEEGWSFYAGIPVTGTPPDAPGTGADVRVGQTPSGRTVVASHVGPYTGLSTSYRKARAYLAAYGLEQAGPEWEQYVSDPGDTPEGELVTTLHIPIR